MSQVDSSRSLHVMASDGPGRRTLFLHGLTASGASWGRILPLCPVLSPVVPDLLGFGDSPKPDARYDLESHLDALQVVVDRYQPTAVVGHSMGAILAVGAMRRWPSISDGVLVSPAVFDSPQQARTAMQSAPFLHRVTLRSRPLARAMCETVCMLRPGLQRVAPIFARDLPADVVRAEFDHTWQSYSRSLDTIVLGGLVPGLLQLVGSRVSIIHGRNDRTVPLSLVQLVEPLVRRLVLIEGDHLALLRRPDAVAGACLDSLAAD